MQAASIEDAQNAGLKYVTADEPGIVRRRRGTGFVYFHPDGRGVKDRATLERIRKLVIPPAWESVWICPTERGHLQVCGRDARGRKQYIYHQAYREARDFNKFNHVIAFGSYLPRIRRVVSRDLGRAGIPKRKAIALVVRLLDETCLRIGNAEYERQNGSHGLTTLKDRHVHIRGREAQFDFRAKSGVKQQVSLKNGRLARLLRQARDIPGEELFQYRSETGETHAIQSSDVNTYLRQISGSDVTAKDFRTWHGTVQMLMHLCEVGPAKTATEAKRQLQSAIKTTATRLGNRPATCRGYYIHPEVIESYLSRKLFKTLSSREKPRTLHDCEQALLTLVRKVHRPRIKV